jgi:hypothetical protein
MSTQPEPLRLADAVEQGNYNHEDVTKAAAELRRLHAVNEELLEALKFVMSAHGEQLDWAFEKARAAIANAGEQA